MKWVVLFALLTIGQIAQAGIVTGSESIAGVVASTDTGDIVTATSVTFSEFFDTSGLPVGTSTGDFLTHIPLGFLTGGPASLSLPGGIGYSIGDTQWGNFTGNLFNDILLPNARTVYFHGIFTPGTNFGGESPNAGTLIIAFTQAGDAHNAISASLTLDLLAIPEPASCLIMGSMLAVGLVWGVRRRN
jgi:hypothetical protein